jgi:hypothetical protein
MDIGGTGKRGSQIFVSPGNPNDVEIGQTPEVFDICINTGASDDEYLYMYQYQNLGAVNQWVSLFKIIPNTFSSNITKSFSAGSTIINVPIANITSTGNLLAANFNIQHSIVGNNPTSSSISVGTIAIVDDVQVLPITINAIEFVDEAWSLLAGTKVIHLTITVV